jgi:hypothetical protein
MNQMEETLRQHKKLGMRSGRAQGGKLTTGNAGNNVSTQVEFGMASEVTVSIDNLALEDKTTAFVTASVSFTIEGNTITRTFDVAAGASISGLAEAVRVVVTDNTKTPHTMGVKYGVMISIAMMPRPNTATPPTLTGAANVAVGPTASTTVPVPIGANSVIVTGTGAAGVVSLQLAQQTMDGTTTLMATDITEVPSRPIALMAGCGQIVVTNLAGASSANVTVQFGIDG